MPYANPASYDEFMGRWSQRLAPRFINFVGLGAAERVLDVGCGTGVLARALLDALPGLEVVGVDPTPSYVEHARRLLTSPRTQFENGWADALPFVDKLFDATLSLLVLQELPDAPRAVREMARITRQGGTIATCKWDFQDGMPMLSLFSQAAEAVAPEAVARRRAERIARPSYDSLANIVELWEDCRLRDIRKAVLEVSLEFASFDDLWRPFLGGSTGEAAFARELNEATEGGVAKRMREMVEAQYGRSNFVFWSRAWAVAGVVAR